MYRRGCTGQWEKDLESRDAQSTPNRSVAHPSSRREESSEGEVQLRTFLNPSSSTQFVCQYCSRTCKSRIGLFSHSSRQSTNPCTLSAKGCLRKAYLLLLYYMANPVQLESDLLNAIMLRVVTQATREAKFRILLAGWRIFEQPATLNLITSAAQCHSTEIYIVHRTLFQRNQLLQCFVLSYRLSQL